MTYIEFYDTTEAENICACLAHAPQRVILVGPDEELLLDRIQRYRKLLKKHDLTPQFDHRCVDNNCISQIINVLSDLVEEYEDCAFDLTGGDDLYLTAVGIVTERYSARAIQMHRFDLRSGQVHDCDLDGVNLLTANQPRISVLENVRLYGGTVVYENFQPGTTPIWDMSPEFIEDIRTMWSICSNPSRQKPEQEWNAQINTLAEADKLMPKGSDPLLTRVPVHVLSNRGEFTIIPEILDALRDACLLERYCYDGDTLELVYKNLQVKKCLTKAGQVLEMAIYAAALELEEDGESVYQDVENGVCIDWDGMIQSKFRDTRNEIDVLMMRGMIPVFVSCKNGEVLPEELYKLNSVAQYFGGHLAVKILVAPALRYRSDAKKIKNRAQELGIHVVDEVGGKSWRVLRQIVKDFWCKQ